MNQEQNNSTETNTNTTVQVNLNKVDPKTVQPTVLGELRTEKIGNPSLLFAFAAIIAVVMILLPLATKMLQDGNSLLYKIVYGNQDVVVDTPVPTQNDPLDGSKLNKLELSSILKVGNLMVKNISLSSGKVDCQIYSYSGTLDLDKEHIYLYIYSSSKEDEYISYVKLTGDSYDHQPRNVTLYNKGLSFNNTHEYYGKIVTLTEDDYPPFDVNADEYGIGTLTCKKDNRVIEYEFQNNYLNAIKETDVHPKKSYTSDADYIKDFASFGEKADLLPGIASVTEEEEGFTYISNIRLEGFEYPEGFKDNNYYKFNEVAKIISYAQIGKGYECE